MNEKYGIELELIMDKFKEKINSIKNAFKSIDNKKVDVSQQVKIDDVTRQFEIASDEAEMLRNKLKTLNAEMAGMQQWQIGTQNYNKLQNEIDKTSIKFQKASAKVDNLNNKLNQLQTKDISTGLNVGFNKLGKGIEKATSKIKRFGLSLFSIRSIYALVSRASSAYIAQDTELANKLQAVWVGLGAMLEPIVNGIANVLLKAVGYINVFIKALTGVDSLAKASAKSMEKATKSAKGLNKTLGGFDELTNIDTTNAGGTGIDTSWVNAFNNVNLNTEWIDKIQNFANWLKENGPVIATIIGSIAGAIALVKLGNLLNSLGEIAKFFVSGTWKTVLGVTLVISGIVLGIMDLIDYIKSLDSGLEHNGTSFKQFGNIITDIGLIITGLGVLIFGLPGIIAGVITIIVGLIVSNWDKIKGFLQKGIDWIDSKMDWIGDNFGFFGKWIAEIFKGAIQVVLNIFDGLFTGIKQIFDGILLIFKGDFKNGFINIGKGIVNALIGIINGATAAINAILYPIRSLIVEVGNILGKNWTMSNISIPKIPLLDVGTNYVPEDQLAYIHKGEAVVPKKFNSQEYFGNGNEETNSLLQILIEKVDNIEINPYTTIKDVGKTAVNYINSRNRQLGGSVIN